MAVVPLHPIRVGLIDQLQLFRSLDNTIALEPEWRDMDSFTGAHVSLLGIL